MNRRDLEERLIAFAIHILKLTDEIPKSGSGKHLSGQLVRSGTSPALNYAESQSAESRKDFIHKMSIALKELRETLLCLTLIKGTNNYTNHIKLENLIDECNQLISIFVKSICTAKKKLK